FSNPLNSAQKTLAKKPLTVHAEAVQRALSSTMTRGEIANYNGLSRLHIATACQRTTCSTADHLTALRGSVVSRSARESNQCALQHSLVARSVRESDQYR